MKIVHRDVTDDQALPECHLAHYYLDREYLMSVRGEVLYVHEPVPEWPGQ